MVRKKPVSISINDCLDDYQCQHIYRYARQKGLTLVELLVLVAILGVLASIGIVSYDKYIYTTRVTSAIKQIHSMSIVIDDYHSATNSYPQTLNDVGMANMKDPWSHAYHYLNIATAANQGMVRKDHNLVPLNTDYDLYSSGEDGQTQPPLTAKVSQDDIVRANDGGFVGLATNY